MALNEFKALFCERYGCAPTEFEDVAFRRLLYWHARVLATLIRKLSPDFFEEDFRFISYLGETTSLREAKADAADFKEANLAKASFWRTGLRIRVSGMTAIKLSHQLFSQNAKSSRTGLEQ